MRKSCRKLRLLFVKTFFLLDFHQDNILPDLLDTFPGNDIFAFPSPETAELSGTGDNQSRNAACFAVKFHIYGTAQTSAGAGIDDFFLF